MTVAVALVIGLVIAAPVQAAACSSAQRTDLEAAAAIAARLAEQGHAGAADTAAVVGRAQNRCATARFARAVSSANERHGAASAGRRASSRGLDLVGVRIAGGAAVWRLDPIRMAGRAARNDDALARLAETGIGARGGGVIWSSDPTRAQADLVMQASTAFQLARSRRAPGRALAQRTLMGLQHPGVTRSTRSLPIVPVLSSANLALRSARLVPADASTRWAHRVAAVAMRRLRSAEAAQWSRVDGAWSSVEQHRALVRIGSQLVVRRPHAATRHSVQRLRRALRSKPVVALRSVPVRAFYPWPADGNLDTRAVTLVVDKPAAITLRIFAADGRTVQTIQREALPRTRWNGVWNGVGVDGQLVPPGTYRYALAATDRAGNRRSMPGVGAFIVARDTKPPVVKASKLTYLGGAPRRELEVRWALEETESPAITSVLVIKGRGEQRTVKLPGTARAATHKVAVRLPAGRYAAFLRFTDGSGNLAVARVGPVRFR